MIGEDATSAFNMLSDIPNPLLEPSGPGPLWLGVVSSIS